MRDLLCTPAGRAEILAADPAVREMLEALFGGDGSPALRVADADDGVSAGAAADACRADGLPLLLLAADPAAAVPPDGCRSACVCRTDAFGAILEAASALTAAEAEPRTELGAISWDPSARTVRCGALSAVLTAREAEVFGALFAASPEPVPRETLAASFSRTAGNGAEVYVNYLRRDLAPLPLKILTLRGRGYALVRTETGV